MRAATSPIAVPFVETELLVATCASDGSFVHRNQAWTNVLGAEADPWARLVPSDRQRAVEAMTQAADGELVTNQLFGIDIEEREDPLPLLLNFLPATLPGTEGAPTLCAITVTGEVFAEPVSWMPNQTQRHRLEALGRMTMGIAHDFNNLLSALLGHAELLKDWAEKIDVAPALKESIGTIEHAAVDGASLIEKIQRHVRQETQTHFEPVDLVGIINDCIVFTRPYWYNEPRRQGIRIDVEAELEPLPLIMGSASELREVFVNLILNAVQAMPEGGTITFSGDHHAHQGVRLRMRDTGLGMSEEVRSRIFEPLFTTKGSEGTGLGLTVSYGIVQEHDGSIRVDSTPGEGTLFTLAFPAAEDQSLREQAPDEAKSSKPAHVLVVDDEQRVRSVLSKLLRLKGHTVEQASSGAEALAMIENDTFDIVFTDHGMPAMNGHQLASALRRRQPRLPIVLVTGDSEVEATKDVNTVLSKPFKLNALEGVIQQFVV